MNDPPQSMVVVETDRLILRQFCMLDGEALDRVFGDAEIMYYGDGMKTQQWVRQWRSWLEEY